MVCQIKSRWKYYQLRVKGVDMQQNERRRWCSDDNNVELDETVACKRGKFADEMVTNFFKKVDPVKRKLFFEWWISFRYTEHELKLCGYTISDPIIFFREIFNSRIWLDTNYVDIAMLLLRERQVKYPTSFGRFNRAILDSNFHELLKLGTTDAMKEYVEGNVFKHGKKWNGCTHLYYPVCTRKHWIAVEVIFSESTIYVYDCDHMVITTSDLEEDLHMASLLIPKLAKFADICTQDTLKIVRVDGLPRQPEPGDCGVYTIKYIEFLSVQKSVDHVNDRYMNMWREKLTCDLFTQNFDP